MKILKRLSPKFQIENDHVKSQDNSKYSYSTGLAELSNNFLAVSE